MIIHHALGLYLFTSNRYLLYMLLPHYYCSSWTLNVFCLGDSNSLLTGLTTSSLCPLECRLHTSVRMLYVQTWSWDSLLLEPLLPPQHLQGKVQTPRHGMQGSAFLALASFSISPSPLESYTLTITNKLQLMMRPCLMVWLSLLEPKSQPLPPIPHSSGTE